MMLPQIAEHKKNKLFVPQHRLFSCGPGARDYQDW